MPALVVIVLIDYIINLLDIGVYKYLGYYIIDGHRRVQISKQIIITCSLLMENIKILLIRNNRFGRIQENMFSDADYIV